MKRIIIYAALSSIYIAAAHAAADRKEWIVGNAAMEIAIDRTTGRIEKLLDKVSGEDFCNQHASKATAGY